MKKTIFLSILLFFATLAISARELKVESFEPLPTDLTARTDAVNDLNGNKCALVKVALPKEGARFLGNVLKEEFFINEYRVYLSQGSKDLQVMCPGVKALMIDLRPYTDNKGLESGMTYSLVLSGFEEFGAQPQNTIQGNYLMLDITPKSGVMVEIDGNLKETDNGNLTTFLGFGPHEISVKAPGYAPYRDIITISAQDKTMKAIRLESIQALLTVNPVTPATSIKINGQVRATGAFNEYLGPGSYLIEVEKEGYRPYAETIELGEKDRKQLDIPALTPIYANLDVAYQPYGATIIIDDKTVGTTPAIIRDILVGRHNVNISMKGYQPYSGTVNLQEDQPSRLAGSLKKDDNNINGHEAVDLGLSVKWAACNVGAEKPSDYGNYYAWGETNTKSNYSEQNSINYGKSMNDIGGTQYDVAHTNWGGNWRMPTVDECQELIDKCNWEKTTIDGHKGYKVTGPNGNSIFLPAAGLRNNDLYDCVGISGLYWTSMPESSGKNAWRLGFFGESLDIDLNPRKFGRSVRPVLNK